MAAKWIVVQCRSGQEKIATRFLRKADLTIYMPVFVDQFRRKRLLFPCYVFLKATPGWQQVFRTEGVSRVLMSGDDPGFIPQSFIKRLQALENRNGNIVLVRPAQPVQAVTFKIGEQLKVLRGAFQGFIVKYTGTGASGGSVGAFKLLGKTVRSEFASGDLISA